MREKQFCVHRYHGIDMKARPSSVRAIFRTYVLYTKKKKGKSAKINAAMYYLAFTAIATAKVVLRFWVATIKLSVDYEPATTAAGRWSSLFCRTAAAGTAPDPAELPRSTATSCSTRAPSTSAAGTAPTRDAFAAAARNGALFRAGTACSEEKENGCHGIS